VPSSGPYEIAASHNFKRYREMVRDHERYARILAAVSDGAKFLLSILPERIVPSAKDNWRRALSGSICLDTVKRSLPQRRSRADCLTPIVHRDIPFR
jgi:hypothetical protein